MGGFYFIMPYNIGDKLNNRYWSGENYGWQSKATHEKLKEEGKFRTGTQAIDRVVSSGMNWATQNVPGVVSTVNAGLKTVGGAVNFTVEQLNKSATGRAVVSTAGAVLETYDQAIEAVSEATNIDKRVTGLATDLAIGALTGGSGTAAKLSTQAATGVAKTLKKGVSFVDDVLPPPTGLVPAMAGGAPVPTRPSLRLATDRGSLVTKIVTVTDPESLRLTGVKTGQDIVSREEAKQLTRRSLKVQQHVDKLDALESKLIESLDLGADAYTIKRLRANIKKERPKLYSARSNVSIPTKEDPLYYGSAEARRQRDALALSKGTTEALEEHHLFPKVVSSAFFAKMDEFIQTGKAELDDLLLMNRVAIAKGRKPGDYKSGMYLLEKVPHNEYHTIMKEAGDEFKLNQAESWAKIVNQAKSVDDLLVLWRGTLDDLVVPTAKNIQSYDKLDALLKEVRSLP